jgi:DNA-binding CsgD family transcriptional regulator
VLQLYDTAAAAGGPSVPPADAVAAPAPGDAVRTRALKGLLEATAPGVAPSRALPSLRAVLEMSDDVDDPDVLANIGNVSLYLGHDAGLRRCYERVLADARNRGAATAVLYALPRLGYAHLLAGEWRLLRDGADEALDLCAAIGQRSLAAGPLAWRTLLAARQGSGEYDALRLRLDEALDRHLGVLTDPVADLSRWAAGVQAGHAGDAAGALHQLSALRLDATMRMATIDRIDAAVRAGENALAREWADAAAAFAEQTQWGWALGGAAYAQAAIAESTEASALYETALLHYADARRPFDLARTHLAYGEHLRRSQRRVDARPHLRRALSHFEDLRAEPSAARAAQELRASGETARKRDPSTAIALTPMELQVAQLVAQGLSNKAVAAQCWISPRTVAFHLRNCFTKTGVTTRGELAQLQLG